MEHFVCARHVTKLLITNLHHRCARWVLLSSSFSDEEMRLREDKLLPKVMGTAGW